MKSSDLLCHASVAGGLLTLESGETIDLALIERALTLIAETEVNANSEPDVMGEALDEAVLMAQQALQQFSRLD